MTPSYSSSRELAVSADHEVVISGISGRFPESNNMNELRDNLMGQRDMLTCDERRWQLDHPHIPKTVGKISNLEKFDAVFFGIHSKQAAAMDPQSRMLLEHAYEAIVDAGVNPKQLRGSKTGVFIGACLSESEKTWLYREQNSGFGITGCSRALFANRISYWLDLVGPSFTIDTACSSSLTAFDQACRSMRDGYCDAAIVGGSNLCLEPYVSMQFFNLGTLAADGGCKTWDESADGYARSEASCVVFLQKSRDAKRVYATVVHSKINCDGFKKEGISFPSRSRQSDLLREVYAESGVRPSDVNYCEAHGTGTKVGDSEEIAAIDAVLGQNRCAGASLLIGSVRSNLGHAEAASGLTSIAKVLLSMESGVIPPNLNFNKCKESLTAILDGRLKVVTDLTPWKGEYAAVNSFGFGGANAHVLLKINPKEKVDNGAPNDDLPRLVVVSGRTEDAVAGILKDLQSQPVDVEQQALLYSIHSDEINGHLHRGYAILPSSSNGSSIQEINFLSSPKRPVWFVFSGVGSQWPGMGEALLRVPVFADAMKKCDTILRPHSIDVFRIITDKSQSVFDNILNGFIGIAAVQIGLVDVLHSLGIRPDYVIGHSVGELGCAYADGCLTAEQTIMSAYYRGYACEQAKLIVGSMAAIGLGHEEVRKLCPLGIEVTCHNSSSTSTISGPAELIKKFVAELKAESILATEVPCSNMPFHSSYMAPAGPKLLSYLKAIIPDPKLRSDKWLSTSLKIDQWKTELARYSSAEYFTNNLLSSVFFEETSTLIPEDAITIEVAPHGLFQTILKRSLPRSVTNIPLTQRGSNDNLEVFLRAIGKMFNAGLHPQLDKLYPPVAFPVSRGTPMISPMVKWDHKDDWFVSYFKNEQKREGSAERVVKINIKSPGYETIADHVLNGRNLLPATSYLTLIWETFGMMKGKQYTELPVVFEDVRFLRATTVPNEGDLDLTLMIQKGTGRFEVVDGDTAIVTGVVHSTSHLELENRQWISNLSNNKDEEYMTSYDVYKEFKLRGYQYTGKFRSIVRATENGLKAHITWHDDWIAFMDNMLQLAILAIDTRELFVPTVIKKILIDPNLHYTQIKCEKSKPEFEAFYDKLHNVVFSGGVQIFGLQARSIARRKFAYEPILEEYKFVSFLDESEMSLRDIIRLATNIGVENYMGIKIKTVEFLDESDEASFKADILLSPWVSEALENMPFIQADVTTVRIKKTLGNDTLPFSTSMGDMKIAYTDVKALLVMGYRLLRNDRAENWEFVLRELKSGGFVLTRENEVFNIEEAAHLKGFHVILKKRCGKEIFALLKKKEEIPREVLVIAVHNDKFDWVESMRKIMSQELDKKSAHDSRVVFVGQEGFDNGLLGFISCLRQEPGGEIVRGILIQDPTAPAFSLKDPLYSQQLEKDLPVSVLRTNGVWGGYMHLQLPPSEAKLVFHSFLKQNIRGDLNSFAWIEGPLQPSFNDENLVNIAYASINYKDVMLASGKLPISSSTTGVRQNKEFTLGFEYSGLDYSGKRIMGMIDNRAIANVCIADPDLSWDVPDNWSLEDAATVPCVYATCCYALYMKGNMKKEDKVLIHAGTGGIGQAAINLALAEGCEVFTTVGTPEKRQFIRNTFPQIGDNHIGNSRDISFQRMIREQTNGYGVDLVLNSLSEEKLLVSVDCLAWGGRFLEIGKFDLSANNPLGMECFLREVSFHGIMLDHFFSAPRQRKLEIKVLVDKFLQSGVITPLVRTVFLKDDVEAAFRYMAAGKHIGKVIIQIQDENPLNSMQIAVPQYYCLKNRSYIVFGGLGGFGLELCDWLIMRGAENIVITSRTGLKYGYQRMRVNLWKGYGVKVIIISNKEASLYKDCQFIIETAEKLAPVDGIFNVAVVLKDALWENQTCENFEESFRPKAWATKNLDLITRTLCKKLRHFVVFSSFFCAKGNAGQSNYGMSNSVMERICEKRVIEGFPALAIQWGPIAEVGIVADNEKNNEKLIFGGLFRQRIISCLDKLNEFMLQSRPIVTSVIVAEKKATSSLDILNSVLNIMGFKNLTGINLHSALPELGMDSMVTVEIKQTLEREFDVFLSAQDIRNLTFAKLQEMADGKNANESLIKDTDVNSQTDKFTEMKSLIYFINNVIISHDTYLELSTGNESEKDEIFAISGIEGFASNFLKLSSKLSAPVTGLQLGICNDVNDSIENMADYFLPHVLHKCKNQSRFTLLGYSFGSLIAIELAKRLEAQGLSGRLFLVDGAPAMIKAIIVKNMSWGNNGILQNECLMMILNALAPQDTSKFVADLDKCVNWNEKVETVIKYCSTAKLRLNSENQKAYCLSLYKRILAAINYDVSRIIPIEAPITLFKPSIKTFDTELEDYGLSRVTKTRVEVHYITGDHVTILNDNELAYIINEHI